MYVYNNIYIYIQYYVYYIPCLPWGPGLQHNSLFTKAGGLPLVVAATPEGVQVSPEVALFDICLSCLGDETSNFSLDDKTDICLGDEQIIFFF